MDAFCSTERARSVGPGHRQAPKHDGQHVELLDLRTVLHRDDHEPALGGETLQVPGEVVRRRSCRAPRRPRARR